jgi:hypothetical protein
MLAARLIEKRRLQRRLYNRLVAYRRQNPVEIVGNIHPDTVRRHIASLEEFMVEARAYRPHLTVHADLSYAEMQFKVPFAYARNPSGDHGPDPTRWFVTSDSLTVKDGPDIAQLYQELEKLCRFPFREPAVEFAPPIAPAAPETPQLPEPDYKVVRVADREHADQDDVVLAQAYAPEFRRVAMLKRGADELCRRYAHLAEEAAAATLDIAAHLAAETQRLIEVRRSISEQFRQAKLRYEDEGRRGIGWMRDIRRRYLDHSKDGVEDHFDLALRMLALPIPPTYPWSVSYDPRQKSLVVVQRVPTLAEIVVMEKAGQEASRDDTERVISRFIPFVLLSIGHRVARSDPMNHVGIIVVEAWSRFYDLASESLQSALVAELRTTKGRLANIDLRDMDPLDAFRTLRGRVTWSKDEIIDVAGRVKRVGGHPQRMRQGVTASAARLGRSG